jgi:hypothetical protein
VDCDDFDEISGWRDAGPRRPLTESSWRAAGHRGGRAEAAIATRALSSCASVDSPVGESRPPQQESVDARTERRGTGR